MHVLIFNAGSSSLKLSLFSIDGARQNSCDLKWRAQIDRGQPEIKLTVEVTGAAAKTTATDGSDESITNLVQCLWTGKHAVVSDSADIKMIGHRVVHGGTKYGDSCRIDANLVSDLRQYVELAPDHEAANIKAIELATKILPDADQVAVFDTAYHHNMPVTSAIYAGPYKWYEQLGIRRFGFHGISHQYCVRRVCELSPDSSLPRIISCHLGSGASLCASLNQKSIMTTMGYTPLDGLVMRTRSGSIDPGIVLHLLETGVYTVPELRKVLNEQSGLMGISGLSGDMREIESELAAGNQRAKLAFDMFVQSVASNIAALVPTLGGLDGLAFTGGIGEHAVRVRSAICERLSFMRVELDASLNANGADDRKISSQPSKVSTFVVSSREDLAIARECVKMLA